MRGGVVLHIIGIFYMKLYKDHRDYKVTNVEWHLCVGELLNNLNKRIGSVTGFGYPNDIIPANVSYWYERNTHYHLYLFGLKHIDPVSGRCVVSDTDPWNRKFKVYPPEQSSSGYALTHHRYYTFRNLTKIVNVMVTTVNGEPVYCVDNIELIDN